MLKLLFVDDDRKSIGTVLNLLEGREDMVHEACDFEDAKERIKSIFPDIVIIDIVNSASGASTVDGLSVRDFVWRWRFCPIVVYSGWPERHDEVRDEHPFIKSVRKGRRGEKEVLRALLDLKPHVAALRAAEGEVRQLFSRAIRDVAPDAFRAHSDETHRKETVLRAGRRRLAALVDTPPINEANIASWEQYLCPPVSDSPQIAEIIRSSAGPADAPDSFRVVLTPSCDMATAGQRRAKTEKVLVAKCCSMKKGLECTSLKDMLSDPKKLRNRLRSSLLTRGSLDGFVPFPALPGRIPTMMANLTDLDLIPITEIKDTDDGEGFVRVAAIDSPFREAVTSAYLQHTGRPGLPDRDFGAWSQEILDSLSEQDGSTKP